MNRPHDLKAICDAILAEWPEARAVTYTPRERIMVDPTDDEIAALMAASDPAGEYLESIRKTDLAKMSQDEWFCFLEVVVTGYQSKLQSLKMGASL